LGFWGCGIVRLEIPASVTPAAAGKAIKGTLISLTDAKVSSLLLELELELRFSF